MLKNENIICISSIDWDFIWQGHQEIMSSFARNGNRVLFIENTGVRAPGIKDIPRIKKRIKNWFRGVKGIRKEAENLYIFSPLALPLPYSRIARWINKRLVLSVLRRWMKVVDFDNPIIWTFLPTPLSLDIADNIVNKLIIYYCIDNFSVSSVSAKKIKRSEEKLLKKADLVFATSRDLYNYCSGYSDRAHVFPFGVNFAEFERARMEESAVPEELKGMKRPIIGYVGGVHKWIDQELIKESAEKHPDYSFVFVGPVQTDVTLFSPLKNVYFLGKKEHGKLPFFIKHFDVCVIPYLITDYTRNVYPTKLNEYLAMAKPVVSTPLPEIVEFNKACGDVVYVSSGGGFDSLISKAMQENSKSFEDKRIASAGKNSWENRIEIMSVLINKEMDIKKSDKEKRWKENLINFYRTARKKVFTLAAVCVSLYLLLFNTPFVWFLASPLKISESPRKTDAIVVFGGGVGETGSPGKSTIERARYAAELYNEGYADKIIFSSGYTYNHNDAENMRLFAVSMGVPDGDIILEQKAQNTHENVVFSKDLLDRHNWKSALLISSPYNMRRAQLVFDRWGNSMNIIYAPVKYSQFYDRTGGVSLEQISAICHEYLGIIYYWFKGYI